jgi:hypothetical protein
MDLTWKYASTIFFNVICSSSELTVYEFFFSIINA